MDRGQHQPPQLPRGDAPPGACGRGGEDLVLIRVLALRAALAALAAGLAGAGGAGGAEPQRPWYLPDQLKLQLAGNIGFVSPGVGWAWAGRRLEADLFFGWVPPAVGGVAVTSLTAKVTWMPWMVPIGRRWAIRPLGGALQVTYTFGDQFFIDSPAEFPEDYYDVRTAVRAGVAVGGAVVRKNGGTLREVGAYWELVALDHMLVSWLRNQDALGPQDAFSLALGVRVAF